MKKITVFIVMALVCLSSFAQTQREGRFGTEILFTPWNPNGNFELVDGIKARFFITDKLAVRTTLDFSINPQSDYTYQRVGDKDVEYVTSSNWTTFGLNPGIEYHFGNYEKLSIYAGAELIFDMAWASQLEENSENSDKIEYVGYSPNLGRRSTFTFGGAVFTGVDYYILSRLYIGAELGLGLRATSTGETKTKITTAVSSVENINKDYTSNARLGFYCTPSIRLGWNF